MFYSFKGYKQDSLLLCMAKKTWKAFLEDVIFSFQKIKTWRAGKEDLQPCCNEKYKGYQEEIRIGNISSRSVKMRGFSFLSLYKIVFIFQFLKVKMYNYGKQNIIVNFIIKKLKKNTISSKSIKTKFSRRENLAFSVLRKVCLFFNFWMLKCTIMANKT